MIVVVLDNAPIYRSQAFQPKIAQWQQKKLAIFWLPTDSPQLTQYLFFLLPTKVWSSSISVISGISSSWGSSDQDSPASLIQFRIVGWLILITLEIPLIPIPLRYISIQVCFICGEYAVEEGLAPYWVPHFLHLYDCFPLRKHILLQQLNRHLLKQSS